MIFELSKQECKLIKDALADHYYHAKDEGDKEAMNAVIKLENKLSEQRDAQIDVCSICE